jgi:hypothetical protein
MWCKKWEMVAGGLLGLGGLIAPVQAQLPMPPQPGAPLGEPLPMIGQSGPPPGAKAPCDPFSLKNDGAPNAFCDDEGQPPVQVPYRIWARGEYLNWRVSAGHVSVPLVTGSSAPATGTNDGALGQSATTILFPAGNYSYHNIGGGRATLGLAPTFLFPFEVSGFWFNKNETLFSAGGDGSLGSPVIARPIAFLDRSAQLGLPIQGVGLVNFPGGQSGTITITSNLSLWGTEANFFYNCGDSDNASFNILVGYRHADLSESININSMTMAVPGTLIPLGGDPMGFGNGNVIGVADVYKARSQFDGGQIGIRATVSAWRLTLATDLKMALGNTHQSLTNYGNTSLFNGGGSSLTFPGGLTNVPSNSSTQTQNRFGFLPELNANVRLRICDNIHVFAGYNLLYWSNVLRAGDHITRFVNSGEIPGNANFDPTFHPTQHLVPLHSSSFYANGVNVGVEIGF